MFAVSYHQTKQKIMEEVIAVFIPIAGMILAFAIVYVTRTASNKEKLSMLEKGFTPLEISEAQSKSKKKNENLSTGLLFIGAATGILIGFFLTQVTNIPSLLAYITCGFLFGGIGLVVAHYLQSKNEEK